MKNKPKNLLSILIRKKELGTLHHKIHLHLALFTTITNFADFADIPTLIPSRTFAIIVPITISVTSEDPVTVNT